MPTAIPAPQSVPAALRLIERGLREYGSYAMLSRAAGVPDRTMRRIRNWQNGGRDGGALKYISLEVLEKIAIAVDGEIDLRIDLADYYENGLPWNTLGDLHCRDCGKRDSRHAGFGICDRCRKRRMHREKRYWEGREWTGRPSRPLKGRPAGADRPVLADYDLRGFAGINRGDIGSKVT